MNDYEIMRVTDPDYEYEYEMAEIWYKGKLIVVITQETKERQVQIFISRKEPLVLDYKKFVAVLIKAHDTLDEPSPLGLVYQQCCFLKNENVKNVHNDFYPLFDPFQHPGYWITCTVKAFHSFNKKDFSLDDFDTLQETKADVEFLTKTLGTSFSNVDRKSKGFLIPTPFTEIKELVDDSLKRMFADGSQRGIELPPAGTENFWNIINKHVDLPPNSSYRYKAAKDEYFSKGDIWGFCFALIDQHGRGVIAHVGACSK